MISAPESPATLLAPSRLAQRIAKARAVQAPPVLLITPPSPFLLDERVFLSLGILKVAAVTYTCKKSGDRLHSFDVDYMTTADYYKGDPAGGYHSYVFTDHLQPEEIVRLRDALEKEVREKLQIPFNPGKPGVRFEHSMGAGEGLPRFILRKTGDTP